MPGVPHLRDSLQIRDRSIAHRKTYIIISAKLPRLNLPISHHGRQGERRPRAAHEPPRAGRDARGGNPAAGVGVCHAGGADGEGAARRLVVVDDGRRRRVALLRVLRRGLPRARVRARAVHVRVAAAEGVVRVLEARADAQARA
jgi:hypothetical protein